jgi:hypothetical protein
MLTHLDFALSFSMYNAWNETEWNIDLVFGVIVYVKVMSKLLLASKIHSNLRFWTIILEKFPSPWKTIFLQEIFFHYPKYLPKVPKLSFKWSLLGRSTLVFRILDQPQNQKVGTAYAGEWSDLDHEFGHLLGALKYPGPYS